MTFCCWGWERWIFLRNVFSLLEFIRCCWWVVRTFVFQLCRHGFLVQMSVRHVEKGGVNFLEMTDDSDVTTDTRLTSLQVTRSLSAEQSISNSWSIKVTYQPTDGWVDWVQVQRLVQGFMFRIIKSSLMLNLRVFVGWKLWNKPGILLSNWLKFLWGLTHSTSGFLFPIAQRQELLSLAVNVLAVPNENS